MRMLLNYALCLVLSAGCVAVEARVPIERLEFHVAKTDLPELLSMVSAFAKQQSWVVENVGPHIPPRPNRGPDFYVNLTREAVKKVTLTNWIDESAMLVLFYSDNRRSDDFAAFATLKKRLRERWPDIHVYTKS
jgi:hypothetical protein